MVTASRPEKRRRAALSLVTGPSSAQTAARGAAFSSPAILRNIGWLLAAQAIAGGGQFALSILLARHLGAEMYGQWAFAFAFVALFSVFADFGFSTLAVRDLAREPELAARYLGNVLALKLALAIALLGAIAAIGPLINGDATVLALILLLGGQMVLTSFSQLLFSSFRAEGRTQFEAAARAFQALLLLGMVAVLVLRGAGVEAFGWAALSAAAAGVVFTTALVARWFVRPALRIDLSLCRSLLREAWPLALSLACTTVYYYADSVMLGVLGRQQEVGWYGAAYVPVLGIVLLIGAIRNAYFPAQSRSLLESRDDHARLLRQYGRITAMLALPLAVGGALLARPFVLTVYGSDYTPATTALRLLFVMSGVMFFSSYFGSELLAGGRQRAYLVGVGAGAVLNLLLNAVLIPQFSLNGAAGATLISEALVCTYMWWQTREHGVALGPAFVRPACAAGLMGASLIVGIVIAPPVVCAAGAGLLYVGMLLLWDGGGLKRQAELAMKDRWAASPFGGSSEG